MFSKDPVSTTLAQATLKTLSVLEPNIIMPAILERAYNGLESINEARVHGNLSCCSIIEHLLSVDTSHNRCVELPIGCCVHPYFRESFLGWAEASNAFTGTSSPGIGYQ